MFSRTPYSDARLADVCRESGISQGSLYFHFGNKADVAAAVLHAQEERMSSVLPEVIKRGGTGLRKLIDIHYALAELIRTDNVVQAGIKLGTQPGLADEAKAPYFEWVAIARTLIAEGVEDGSIVSTIDVHRSAEFVNKLFVGTQVLSELEDSWASFPLRVREMLPYVLGALGASDDS